MLTQRFIRRSATLAFSVGERAPGFDRDRPGIAGPDESEPRGKSSTNHMFAGMEGNADPSAELKEAAGSTTPKYSVDFDPTTGENRLMIK